MAESDSYQAVHVIASKYGWSEDAILAKTLSDLRVYVGMILAEQHAKAQAMERAGGGIPLSELIEEK